MTYYTLQYYTKVPMTELSLVPTWPRARKRSLSKTKKLETGYVFVFFDKLFVRPLGQVGSLRLCGSISKARRPFGGTLETPFGRHLLPNGVSGAESGPHLA